jgi:hypothetical protein
MIANQFTGGLMLKRLTFTALAALALLSCSSSAPPPSMSFKRFTPIYMTVSGIQVVEEYKSPMHAPNVEHLMPYSPATAMQLWVRDRLRPAGGERTMQVVIKDASVVAKGGDPDPSFISQLDPTNREYNARLEVELRIYEGGFAMSEASINVVATRTISISPSLSASTRDDKFYKMINQMMDVMNAELEKNIYQYLGDYVNYSLTP